LLHHWAGSGRPHMVSVDLGLPPDEEGITVGLQLLQTIHERFNSLPLAVHSLKQVKDYALHQIITTPASYISLQDESFEAFAMVLPLMMQGYLVFSPKTALMFPSAIVSNQQTDPLQDDEWEVLRMMAQGLTYKAIGDVLHFEETAMWPKVHKIAAKLKRRGFIDVTMDSNPDPRRYKNPLTNFYNEHHVRYGRP
jgi:DNA-binding NarL/FixJ family response regulator